MDGLESGDDEEVAVASARAPLSPAVIAPAHVYTSPMARGSAQWDATPAESTPTGLSDSRLQMLTPAISVARSARTEEPLRMRTPAPSRGELLESAALHCATPSSTSTASDLGREGEDIVADVRGSDAAMRLARSRMLDRDLGEPLQPVHLDG